MSKMTIGINLYSLREQVVDPAGLKYTLTRLGEIGYKTVQVSGVKLEPEVTAEVLKQTGMKCAATHVGWPQIRDETDRIIEIHRMYDCKHVAMGGIPAEYKKGLSGIDRFARELPEVMKKLSAAGLDLSYHNHQAEFAHLNGKVWLELFFEATKAAGMCAEIDTYWVQTGGGDPVLWVRKMAGREPLLHVKDMCVTLTGEVRFAPIGAGNLNWPAILKAAEESGVEYVLVEQDHMYEQDPFEAAEISYKTLSDMGLK